MRIGFIILIAIHGIIHLFGFFKAFRITEFNAISQPISKTFGLLWLLTFLLFAITVVLLISQSHYWWIIGILGAVLSQFLIINYWSDAKFGTIVNLVVLVTAITGYANFGFHKTIDDETTKMFENAKNADVKTVTEEMISDLPTIVQKWLLNSGTIGKEPVYNVYLEQDLQMLMKPEQEAWSHAKAKQYFMIEPPAFNWSVNLKMNPVLEVVGRDKFENGKGEMIIKLFSLFSIANAKDNKKVNQATLQRYLAEIFWFPSAAISPYISWQELNDHAAEATMKINETEGSGVFYFDDYGNFKKFVAMRYKDAKDSEPTEWTVSALKTEIWNGIKIPVELKAEWKLEHGHWTWLKLKITDIKYNSQKNTKS